MHAGRESIQLRESVPVLQDNSCVFWDCPLATVKTEAQTLRIDIVSAVAKPVVSETSNTMAEVKEFVQSEAASGQIVGARHGL
jgi:hypothetical protein